MPPERKGDDHRSCISLLQYEVRLKTIAQRLLGGKKKNWHHADRWIGDELGSPAHNPKAAQFKQVVRLQFILVYT